MTPWPRLSCPTPTRNLKLVTSVLARHGFGDHWAFRDSKTEEYLGIPGSRCTQLLRDADGIINLCGALDPREEHANNRCLVYLGTDPGQFQVELQQGEPKAVKSAAAHKLFFTYACNLGGPACLLPTGGLAWIPTKPPVLLDQWEYLANMPDSGAFTTVATWENREKHIQIKGEKYSWSKHVNFLKMLEVPGRSSQEIELATDLQGGPDYERMSSAGFRIRSAIPMSLDVDEYRNYVGTSRGEFTVAKDVVARTRSGWFSDRSVCYLAAGRPVVTQRTGFEGSLPTGVGLLSFDDAEEAVEAIRSVNGDYGRHSHAAHEIAAEYFDATKLLKEIVEAVGL